MRRSPRDEGPARFAVRWSVSAATRPVRGFASLPLRVDFAVFNRERTLSASTHLACSPPTSKICSSAPSTASGWTSNSRRPPRRRRRLPPLANRGVQPDRLRAPHGGVRGELRGPLVRGELRGVHRGSQCENRLDLLGPQRHPGIDRRRSSGRHIARRHRDEQQQSGRAEDAHDISRRDAVDEVAHDSRRRDRDREADG